jgi:hypothetical protein
MLIIAWIIVAFLGLRALVALINLLTRQWLEKSRNPQNTLPFVSVLIPARDEEENLGELLDLIVKQDYPHYEVVIYDDGSKDGTPEIIRKIMLQYPLVRLAKPAGEPPAGWLGKNWACHNLALAAKGNYLMFLDADVKVSETCIRDVMNHMLSGELHLFSLFPVQRMLSNGEKLLVPLMNRILVTLLPLILTRISRKPSLSAANGQTMLFRADTYRKHNFHEAVKGYPVEDIRIFRMMKQHNLRSHTMLSGGQVSCRMYHGYQEALNGFSKNVFAFFGGSAFVTIIFALTTALGWLPVLLSGHSLLMMLWAGLSLLTIILVSVLSKQSVFDNLLLAVPQQVAFLHLILRALRYRIFGGFQWKGRSVNLIK